MKPVPLEESSIDRTEKAQRWLGLVSMLTAVISTVFAASFTILKSGVSEGGGTPGLPVSGQSQETLAAQVEGLKRELELLRANAAKAATLPDDAKLAQQLVQLASTGKSLDDRLQRLEAVILSNPAKALEIPLLQRDLEALRVAQQTNQLAAKDSVDRLYDISKWLLGTMAISIITMALSNLLKPRPAPERKD